MKNKIFSIFSSNIKISVSGKNVNNFIKRVITKRINIVKLIPKSHREVELIIDYNDLEKINKYKSLYDVKIIKYYGKLRILKFFYQNIYIIVSIVIGILLIYTLSNIIFDIDVIHSNKKIISLVENELKNHGIKKYSFAKKYNELEEIKEDILKENKDVLEWIEIIREGTRYVIRVEERIINSNIEDSKKYDIIAKKSSVIKTIVAYQGEKVKEKNTYVKKGEVIISSNVTLPNNEKINVGANGEVVGEVWYQIDIEYPYNYTEIKYTGKEKKVLVFNFLQKRISLFDFNKYKNFNKDTKFVFEDQYLPISLVWEHQYETNYIDEIYTYEEAKNKAVDKAKEKLLEKYPNIKKINSVKIIKEEDLSSKVYLSLFITCDEDITEYKEAEEIIGEKEE